MLIDGHPFTINLYFLITCCDPLTLLLHKEGQVVVNVRSHNKKYGYEKRIMSLQKLNQLISIQYRNEELSSHLWTQIKDVIIKATLSIQSDLLHNYKSMK